MVTDMISQRIVTICICVAVCSAQQAAPAFSAGAAVGKIDSIELNEVSGCAASRKFKGVLYMHNDHGDRPRIFAVNASTASVIATLEISPAAANDWEDIAVGPCSDGSSQSCIYILDDGRYHNVDKKTIYRVIEPDTLVSQTIAPDSTVRYNWTEKAADTVMVDNHANVYIISTVLGGRGQMARLPGLVWGAPDPIVLDSGAYFSMYSSHTDPEGGDISFDGNEVLVKTSGHVYYWRITETDLINTLTHAGADMPYIPGGIAEAVCWAADASAYYTISEGAHATLNMYERA